MQHFDLKPTLTGAVQSALTKAEQKLQIDPGFWRLGSTFPFEK